MGRLEVRGYVSVCMCGRGSYIKLRWLHQCFLVTVSLFIYRGYKHGSSGSGAAMKESLEQRNLHKGSLLKRLVEDFHFLDGEIFFCPVFSRRAPSIQQVEKTKNKTQTLFPMTTICEYGKQMKE